MRLQPRCGGENRSLVATERFVPLLALALLALLGIGCAARTSSAPAALGSQSTPAGAGTSGAQATAPAPPTTTQPTAQGTAAGPVPPAGPAIATPGMADVGAARYLDDRSGPVEVVRSYFNAINRQEYDRAYSYWEPAAADSQLPPYPAFKQGYADTESVTVTTGAETGDAGAGQLYYSVPVTLRAQTAGGGLQTFAGCYRLHLSQPAIQDAPPYHPLAIISASIQQVPNDADRAALMTQSCRDK